MNRHPLSPLGILPCFLTKTKFGAFNSKEFWSLLHAVLDRMKDHNLRMKLYSDTETTVLDKRL